MSLSISTKSVVIYRGETCTVTASADKILTSAVLTVTNTAGESIPFEMDCNGSNASYTLSSLFDDNRFEKETECLYQVKAVYTSKENETTTSGNVTEVTNEEVEEYSDKYSVIFRETYRNSLRAKKSSGIINIPLFDRSTLESSAPSVEKISFQVNGSVQAAPAVDDSHPLASDIRVKTPKGIMSLSGDTPSFTYKGGAKAYCYGDVTHTEPGEVYSYISSYGSESYISGTYTYSYNNGSYSYSYYAGTYSYSASQSQTGSKVTGYYGYFTYTYYYYSYARYTVYQRYNAAHGIYYGYKLSGYSYTSTSYSTHHYGTNYGYYTYYSYTTKYAGYYKYDYANTYAYSSGNKYAYKYYANYAYKSDPVSYNYSYGYVR